MRSAETIDVGSPGYSGQGWNRHANGFVPIHYLIEEQARISPETIALECNGVKITYAQLNSNANILAHRLIGAGVKDQRLVGLFCQRSIDMVTGLLSILKAGSAYLPIDPQIPQQRLRRIFENAGIQEVILQQSLLSHVSRFVANPIVISDQATPQKKATANLAVEVRPEDLAYVIYTSGSTGQPKGVMVTHLALSNILRWAARTFDMRGSDKFLATTSISFDIAALELLLPLTVGACVVLTASESFDPREVAQRMSQGDITFMQATPSLWDALSEEMPKTSPMPVTILCGGETLTKDTATRLHQFSPVVWNLYGPTETTIWSSSYRVHEITESIPIGMPIDETEMYILGENGKSVSMGEIGTLHIGGYGLARGYLDAPELTAAKFKSMQVNGKLSRLYDTGDLARYLPDGNIEFVGRLDSQIKIRGNRVELGEIESTLRMHPSVREAVLLADKARTVQLVAYIVARQGKAILEEELRSFVREQLPDYMVPTQFIFLHSVPLTIAGKVDRVALASLQKTCRGRRRPIGAHTNLQRELIRIWTTFFNLKEIGIKDNFQEFGGDSILAAQLISRINHELSSQLLPRALYENPNIESLAIAVKQSVTAVKETDAKEDATAIDRRGPTRERLRSWFVSPFDADNSYYGAPTCIKLNFRLEMGAVRQALKALLIRKGLQINALHLSSTEVVNTDVDHLIDISEIDLQPICAQYNRKQIWQQLYVGKGPTDTSTEMPLLRAKLFRLSKESNLLCVAVHYMVAQSWPPVPLFQEIIKLLNIDPAIWNKLHAELWVEIGA